MWKGITLNDPQYPPSYWLWVKSYGGVDYTTNFTVEKIEVVIDMTYYAAIVNITLK